MDLHKSIKGGDRDCLETRKTPPAWRSAYNKTKPNSWYLLCVIYTGPSFVVLYQSGPSPTNLKRTTLSIKPNWAFNYPSPINPTFIIEENATRNLWRIARHLSPEISSVFTKMSSSNDQELLPEQTQGFKVGEKRTIDEYHQMGTFRDFLSPYLLLA